MYSEQIPNKNNTYNLTLSIGKMKFGFLLNPQSKGVTFIPSTSTPSSSEKIFSCKKKIWQGEQLEHNLFWQII